MAKHEGKYDEMDPEVWKDILGVVSSEIPALIKSILSSVFSEEAGRNMGKAAAAYYKELKAGGLPEPVAVNMTQEYMRTFTSLGDMLKSAGKGGWGPHSGNGIDLRIEKRINSKREEEE